MLEFCLISSMLYKSNLNTNYNHYHHYTCRWVSGQNARLMTQMLRVKISLVSWSHMIQDFPKNNNNCSFANSIFGNQSSNLSDQIRPSLKKPTGVNTNEISHCYSPEHHAEGYICDTRLTPGDVSISNIHVVKTSLRDIQCEQIKYKTTLELI